MKCERCHKYESVYHVSNGYGGLEASCAQCLTPDEKEHIDITRNHQDVCGVEGCTADGYKIDYTRGIWVCENHAKGLRAYGAGLREKD